MRIGTTLGALALSCILALGSGVELRAQQGPDPFADRARALKLVDEGKFLEALPILERLVAASPKDVVALEKLAMAIVAYSVTLPDAKARREQRARARRVVVQARDAGSTSNYVDWALDALPEDGGDDVTFSAHAGVDEIMKRGEAAFGRGDYAAAAEAYQLALSIDPKLYYAALFLGDIHFVQKQHDKAGEWFKRATEIDPDIETAHRYWGDALMQAERRDEARDRFVDAVIAQPYSRESRIGLAQWADHFGVSLYLPAIDTGSKLSTKDGKMTITVDPNSLGKKDGSAAWLVYGVMRAAWQTGRFKEAFPKETAYRHSLAEEVEALGAVAEAVDRDIKSGELDASKLEPSLAYLRQLHADGLVDAYVLFAIPDEGIAQDYAGWRATNRAKMRRFLVEYVVGGKGLK
jgi:tetratricopeptide (TPR) repeat protein